MLASAPYCPNCGAANQAQATQCFACGKPLSALDDALPSLSSPLSVSANGSTASLSSGTLTAQFLLRQRYRILAQVGQGGFGAVYKAVDTQLGHRVVAVKEMSQVGLTTQELSEATEAFQREALLLSGLKHPNLPSVYDQFIENGRWYLVMEFIEGETLEAALDRLGGKLPLDGALQLALELCNALIYLHTRQPPVIFRDLKPSNIMLTPEGKVCLIDFGIARHFKPGQSKDTIAFGSPGYAAPEQYGKAQTTPRSDIYGLGALLHHLISGEDPSNSPFRFAPLPAFCPASLQTLVKRMVDLEEQKRPATMVAVSQELQRIAASLSNGQSNAQAASTSFPTYSSTLPSVTPKTREQWLEDGNDHCTAGRYQAALSAYNVALQLDADYADAYTNKGVALYELKRYSEAVDAYRRAAQLNPDDATTQLNMGLALSTLKRHDEALRAYEQAIQLEPTRLKAYTSKGLALGALKRYAEALTTFEQVNQMAPDIADVYAWKGDMLTRLKRYEEALLAYERASRLNPRGSKAYERSWGWRRAKRKAQHAFSRPYVRRLMFSSIIDLIFIIGMLLLWSANSAQTNGPFWLLGGGALLILWGFIPRLLRLDDRSRQVAGVFMGLLSVLAALLIWISFPGISAWFAFTVEIKCMLPALLLILSPRKLPEWIPPAISALSFGVSGLMTGWLLAGGIGSAAVIGAVIGLGIGLARMRPAQ